MTVNLGTGTPEEARNWVKHCNSPTGSYYADLQAENASPKPYDLKLWCLGNEMDGTGEIVMGAHPKDQNTYKHPKTIISHPFSAIKVLGGKGQFELPPLSVAAVTFEVG